jgi:hypothetical protein
LLALIDWLERTEAADIVLIDNDSAYPPLLDYLARTPHRVVRTGSNLGPRVTWLTGIAQEVGLRQPYVVTDPDVVPDQDCPLDLFEHLAAVLREWPGISRVGVGLRIDDLPPDSPRTADIVTWEEQFWEREVAPGLFDADVDTTLAMYRPGRRQPGRPSFRTGPPYVARHLPWYESPSEPDEETAFYRLRADPAVNSWDLETLPPYLRALIDGRGSREPGGGRG